MKLIMSTALLKEWGETFVLKKELVEKSGEKQDK